MNQIPVERLGVLLSELKQLFSVLSDATGVMAKTPGHPLEAQRYFDFISKALQRGGGLAAEASDVLQLAVVTSPNPEGKPPVGGNHGSTEMPAASSLPSLPEPTAEPESSIPGLVNPNGKNEIILVVDDEEVVVTTVAQMLAFGDYKVLPCTGGLKALEHLRAYGDSISLVLLDYTMPVMDGGEVFEAMQKIRQDVAVLLTSGFGEQAKMRSMLMKGLRGFLPEPYEPDKLLGAVRSALDVERTRRTGERRMM